MTEGGLQRRGRRGLLVLGLVLLLGLAATLAWLARRPEFAGLPVPNPNGYDALLAAARLVTGQPPAQGVTENATDDDLRAFVARNARALTAAQAGFSQESVVPLGTMESIEAHVERSGPFRQLGRLLACQAELARREGRTSDALQANLNLLRLAHAVSRGGLLADQLTGAALQRLAIRELEGPLLLNLSSADARRAIPEIERLDRDREPVQQIANRDLDFALSRQGLQMRAAYVFNRKTLDGLRAPAIKAAESSVGQLRNRTRLLLVKLALHAYALDHPDTPRPDDLRALVPSYLAEVPLASGNDRRLTLGDLSRQSERSTARPERP